MTHEDTAIDSAPMPVLTKVSPCIQILGAYSLDACKRLEPWATQTIILEHGHAPEVETHPGPAALHQFARSWRLRAEIEDRVFWIPPDLGYTTLTFCPVKSPNTRQFRVSFHLLDQLDKPVSRGDVVVLDRENIFPSGQLDVRQDLLYGIVIRISYFLPQSEHPKDWLIWWKDE